MHGQVGNTFGRQGIGWQPNSFAVVEVPILFGGIEGEMGLEKPYREKEGLGFLPQPPELVPLQLRPIAPGGDNSYSRYILYSIMFIGFFVLFMFVSQTYMDKYEEIKVREVQVSKLKVKKDELELENRILARKIEELRTPIGQEKIARQQLKLIKPGESLIDWKE